MKISQLSQFLILTVLCIGCQNGFLSPSSSKNIDEIINNLNQIECFSITTKNESGWTGSQVIKTLDQSGKLRIEEKSEIFNYRRVFEYKTTKDELNLIKQTIIKVFLIDIMDSYGTNNVLPTDMPTFSVSIKLGTFKASFIMLSYNESELPKELSNLLILYNQIITKYDVRN